MNCPWVRDRAKIRLATHTPSHSAISQLPLESVSMLLLRVNSLLSKSTIVEPVIFDPLSHSFNDSSPLSMNCDSKRHPAGDRILTGGEPDGDEIATNTNLPAKCRSTHWSAESQDASVVKLATNGKRTNRTCSSRAARPLRGTLGPGAADERVARPSICSSATIRHQGLSRMRGALLTAHTPAFGPRPTPQMSDFLHVGRSRHSSPQNLAWKFTK